MTTRTELSKLPKYIERHLLLEFNKWLNAEITDQDLAKRFGYVVQEWIDGGFDNDQT